MLIVEGRPANYNRTLAIIRHLVLNSNARRRASDARMKTKAISWMMLAYLLRGGVGFGAAPAQTMDILPQQPSVVAAEFIFERAPSPQCHASTIAETPTGLIAAWFGGTKEKQPDVGIWLSRHVDGSWTTPIEVANGIQYRRPDGSVQRHPCWNPVLFQPRDGPLLLFYKCGPEPSRWWGMLMTSSDYGRTWSVPRRLPEGIIGPVKNKPVELADGTLVCPSSTEHDGWRLHLETTRDLGNTWMRIGPINDGKSAGAIQPSILFHPDGRWQILARDRRRVGNVWTTWSDDGGRTWTELESAGLPNPSSGTDAVTLAGGQQVLVYNHTQRANEDAEIGDSRGTLNVAVSNDGVTWQAALVLEQSDGEYSYPAVIQTADGLVHIAYTWRRERIKHVVFDPAKLQPRPIVEGEWPAATRRTY
jgi:predicted neuraminidase